MIDRNTESREMRFERLGAVSDGEISFGPTLFFQSLMTKLPTSGPVPSPPTEPKSMGTTAMRFDQSWSGSNARFAWALLSD